MITFWTLRDGVSKYRTFYASTTLRKCQSPQFCRSTVASRMCSPCHEPELQPNVVHEHHKPCRRIPNQQMRERSSQATTALVFVLRVIGHPAISVSAQMARSYPDVVDRMAILLSKLSQRILLHAPAMLHVSWLGNSYLLYIPHVCPNLCNPVSCTLQQCFMSHGWATHTSCTFLKSAQTYVTRSHAR